jgi:hypothetical protein
VRPRESGRFGRRRRTGFAALALLNAELRPGIELMLGWLDFDRTVGGADLAITGEGSLDEQSLAGKAPVGVAKAAAWAGVTAVAVAGRNLLSDERLRSAGITQVYPLTRGPRRQVWRCFPGSGMYGKGRRLRRTQSRCHSAHRSRFSHPRVRWLTLFMGLQAVNFYTMVAWLPSMLRDEGLNPSTAGAMLAIATVLGIPAGLFLSTQSDRVRRPAGLVVAATGLTALGWAGLLLAPIGAPVLWAALLGLGTGATFPLALTLIAGFPIDATRTPHLSAVVQGWGYLVAATGPLLIGLFRDASGGWTIALGALVIITAGQALAGWFAGHHPTGRR